MWKFLFGLATMFATAPAIAETITLSPSATCDSSGIFEETANRLRPGDELVLTAGTYCQTGRRLITVSGTADAPIVIRGAGPEKPVLTRPGKPTERHKYEGTEFRGAHLVIRGLHFRGGKRGLVFHAGAHHITVEDSEISDTSNNGLTLNNGDTHHFIIRRNHIHHTGNLDPALGGTEGEGMYIGCNNARCIAHDHLIEGNEIHDLRANGAGGNDGIEIKFGSYGNIVRNNVIHTLFPAIKQTKYPCIFAYGTLDAQQDRPNIIEDNIMWGCGEAIQVISDAVVRNNVIMNSQSGLATYYHAQVSTQRNLRIENNIFFRARVDLHFGFQASLEKDPDAIRKPPPRNIVFSHNRIFGPGQKPLATVNLPEGGDVILRENRTGDLSDTGLVIVSDPAGIVGPGSFIPF